MTIKNRNLKIDEKVYFLKNIKTPVEVQEEIKKFSCENEDHSMENGDSEIEGKEISVDLGQLKFVVCPVKIKNNDIKAKVIKSDKKVEYGEIKINDKAKKFKSDLFFAIYYSSEKKFNFIFEELMEHIIEKIDMYREL